MTEKSKLAHILLDLQTPLTMPEKTLEFRKLTFFVILSNAACCNYRTGRDQSHRHRNSNFLAVRYRFRPGSDCADVMVTGGTEGAITEYGIGGFCQLKALCTNFNDAPHRASRPFDKDRDGFVMGEGAGILILEEWEHATRRGAKIYAELAGFGSSADAKMTIKFSTLKTK